MALSGSSVPETSLAPSGKRLWTLGSPPLGAHLGASTFPPCSRLLRLAAKAPLLPASTFSVLTITEGYAHTLRFQMAIRLQDATYRQRAYVGLTVHRAASML